MRISDFKAAMLSFLNIQYNWGGSNPMTGYDCSGFVQELLAIIGVDPPEDQTAQALYDAFYLTSTFSARETGALCFYGKSKKEISHIAMMFDEKCVIEAGGGNSKTIDVYAAKKQNAYIRLRPYDRRKDLVAVILPDAIKSMLV